MADFPFTRRVALAGIGAAALGGCVSAGAAGGDPLADFRTPYKFGKLVLAGSGVAGSFDEKTVDVPFVFSKDGKFYLTYVGWEGTGYATGMAESDDLVNWRRLGLILPRDPNDPVARYSIAMASILRENGLKSPGRLRKVGGRYLGVWHAYPAPGYEAGPAVIGLAWSDDLMHWERTAPILRPEDGGDWERGGLYKPYIVEEGGTYYIFYNAKTEAKRWNEQIGVATSRDLKTWTRHSGNPIIRNGQAGAPDDRFVGDPVVVRNGKLWGVYYYGLSSDRAARDLLATGTDPYTLTKQGVMVDVGPPGSVDETYAHKPTIIHHDGALYHFYCAVAGKWPNETRGLAVARSKPW